MKTLIMLCMLQNALLGHQQAIPTQLCRDMQSIHITQPEALYELSALMVPAADLESVNKCLENVDTCNPGGDQ